MKPIVSHPIVHTARPPAGLVVALCCALLLASLTSCINPGAGGKPALLPNAILLWHNLPKREAAALDAILDRYRRANPEVEVLVQPQGADMNAGFLRAARSGLGPNLLVIDSTGLRDLVAAGAVLPLDQLLSADDLARYLRVALRTLRVDGRLYGQPMAVDTQVLYYNRDLTDRPPGTIDQLMQAVNRGQRVLMNSQFTDMVWSARAFGVELFDSQDHPQDTSAGIANWLAWMEQVRDTPGFILDDNSDSLRNRFREGDIPYYIGRSAELNTLELALGGRLGVAQLPAGPGGSAGPPLTTTALLINSLSSRRQIETALDLARFITSSDQQAALMREANLAPANSQTRISEGLYPRIATITAQARTSIPLSNEAAIQDAYGVLATAFHQTMTGMAYATEAAAAARAALVDEHGFPAGQATGACNDRGQLALLAGGTADQLATLDTLVAGFARLCPHIAVTVTHAATSDWQAPLQSAVDPAAADLFFLPHVDLPALVEADAVAPVADLLDPALAQQMRPIALLAMRSGDELYGVPLFVDLQVLYHNRALALDPAGTLADLRAQAQAGAPVTLDGTFAWGFWGVGAFGGQLFEPAGQFALSPTALTRWLTWLQESGQRFGIRTTPARSEARQLFLEGASAYYVGVTTDLGPLTARLGEEDLAVALMPQGPAGPGRPLATVDGLMVSAALSAPQRALAARFLNYAAGVPAQTELLDQRQVLPANGAVRLGSGSNIARIAVQLQTSTLLQSTPWLPRVFQLGDEAYSQVLQQGVAPDVAVAKMYETLSAEAERYGISVPLPEPTPQPTPTSTPAGKAPPDAAPAPAKSGAATPTPPPSGRAPGEQADVS